jgi:hypothetical protein
MNEDVLLKMAENLPNIDFNFLFKSPSNYRNIIKRFFKTSFDNKQLAEEFKSSMKTIFKSYASDEAREDSNDQGQDYFKNPNATSKLNNIFKKFFDSNILIFREENKLKESFLKDLTKINRDYGIRSIETILINIIKSRRRKLKQMQIEERERLLLKIWDSQDDKKTKERVKFEQELNLLDEDVKLLIEYFQKGVCIENIGIETSLVNL